MIAAIREQAAQVLLSYADDADRQGKPHVAHSERQMAAAAIAGYIDNGATIQRLVQEAGIVLTVPPRALWGKGARKNMNLEANA